MFFTDSTDKTIGERIAFIRKELGYTQAEFAKEMGIGRMTLQRYESDTNYPDVPFMLKLAEDYEINFEWLLLGKGFEGTNIDELTLNEKRLVKNFRKISQKSQDAIITILEEI